MKVTTEEYAPCEILMTVEVEEKQAQDILKKSAKRIARDLKIPGFRPGKAPFNVVVRRFGWEAVQREALEESADKLIQKALIEANVTPYAQVSLEKIDWNPLTFQIKVPVSPKVELDDYRSVRIETEPVIVTDDDVQEVLEDIQKQKGTWVPVERPAEIGDLVTMSMVEKDGETVINESESVEHELTFPEEHEGHDHPDMTTPLLGLSAGDEKTFTLRYPDEFKNEQYAGKEITFDVKVSAVKEEELDPLDDEFAQAFSDFETLEAFKDHIRQRLLKQRQQERDNKLGNQVLERLVERSTVEWPKALEDEQVDKELKSYERQMQSYGLTLESYYAMQNQTEEEFIESIRDQVIDQVERSLVVGKLVHLEKLDVSEGEILERAKLLSDYSGNDTLWRDIMASQSQQNAIASDLLFQKAIQLLAQIAKGEAPELEKAEADESEATQELPATDEQAEPAADIGAEVISVDEVAQADPTIDETAAADAPAAQPEPQTDEESVTH